MVNANLILNAYVSVDHFKPDAGNSNQEGYVSDASLAAVPVNIQPSSPEITVLNGGAYGKGYTIFTTNSGILETDRLTTVSGNYSTVFIVKGKQNFNYGLARHIEIYAEETQ